MSDNKTPEVSQNADGSIEEKPKADATATASDFTGAKKEPKPGKDMAELDNLKKFLESKELTGKTVEIRMPGLRQKGQDSVPVFVVGPGGQGHDQYWQDQALMEVAAQAANKEKEGSITATEIHRVLIGKYCIKGWKDFFIDEADVPDSPVPFSQEAAEVVAANLPTDMITKLINIVSIPDVFRRQVSRAEISMIEPDLITEDEAEKLAGN